MLNTEVAGHHHRIPKRPFGSFHKNDRLTQSVSIIGLGCSSFSTFFLNHDEISKNNSDNELTIDRLDPNHPIVQSWINTIEYAITVAGITLLDTAPWYGHGTSEVVIGYAMTKLCHERKLFLREELTINTKVGRYEADPTQQFDFSSEATIKSVERSIRRLCCGSYIDVLQLHDPEFAPSMDLLFQETIPAMIECQKKGWCRALGITGAY
jgi:aryl-alcohol dehydrogenase-like predicted oxidoreductase